MPRLLLLLICFGLSACQDTSVPLKEEVLVADTTKKIITECTVTCPGCGHKKKEIMPTDVCVGRFTCEQCDTVLLAKAGDCCVYCSYGDVICPPEQ